MIDEDALNIFTDGSMYSGPRTGGIGIRFVTVDDNGNEKIHDLELPGYKGATNNQMELHACVVALREAQKVFDLSTFTKIIIFSDSRYVVDNYKNALFYWPTNRWKNRDGRPIENSKIWKELTKELRKPNRRIEFEWVKGHSKNIHNRAADKLAKKSAKNATNKPLAQTSIRRKTTIEFTKVGSVEMKGQRLKIRVITTEYLRDQKLYKYRYEVLSKTSRYKGNVDLIFSPIAIRDGHCYTVTVNKNTKNPRLSQIIEEFDCKTGEKIE